MLLELTLLPGSSNEAKPDDKDGDIINIALDCLFFQYIAISGYHYHRYDKSDVVCSAQSAHLYSLAP